MVDLLYLVSSTQIIIGQLQYVAKVQPRTGGENLQLGSEVYLYSFCNLGAIWDGWSTPRPGRFTPGKEPVPIV